MPSKARARSDQSLCSNSDSSDIASESRASSVVDSSVVSVIEASAAAGSQVQFNANTIFHGPFLQFHDPFANTVGHARLIQDSGANCLAAQTSLSPPNLESSPDDTASPADTSRGPATPDNTFAIANDPAWGPSPLTRISSTPPPSELYFMEWHKGVAALLPPVFRDITAEMPDFQPLQNAVLAISAAHLAHLESLIVRTNYRTRKSRYIPQKDHQYQSLQFYSKGIQGIGRSLDMLPQMNPVHVLAALLLFYYFELDSGSFNGGIGHMTVIDRFLSSHLEEIRSSPKGEELLQTWMNMRSQFVNRYLGGYRSSRHSQSIDPFPLNRPIIDEGSGYDSITIIMCDCKLLSRKIIVDWCVTRGEYRNAGNVTVNETVRDNILTQLSLPRSRQESASQLAALDDSYRESLQKQQARLDKWHSALDLSELPVDSYGSQRPGRAGLEIHPLKFHTFEAAMKYAYYAHARMLCSDDIIDRLAQPTFVEPPFTRRDSPWTELILRITAGLDIADCVYKNTFNTGILSILAACLVACPRGDVAAWIEEFMRKVEDFGVPLESGLPFGVMKRIVRFILNERRENGHDVFIIIPLDVEDAEKSDLYHSDFQLRVLVCGKDMHTGKRYNEAVEIPEA